MKIDSRMTEFWYSGCPVALLEYRRQKALLTKKATVDAVVAEIKGMSPLKKRKRARKRKKTSQRNLRYRLRNK